MAATLALLVVTATAARAANYVALGDSYAAGPLIPNPVAAARLPQIRPQLRRTWPRRHRPDAARRQLQRRDDERHDRARRTSNPAANPPQFNSLDASTTVVSLTIGGNDIGFAEVAESCITINPFSHPCHDKYDAGGNDQLAERIAATAPKVAAVLQGIHSRSPAAKIYVVNYPAIFPETGSGCWPQMPIGFQDVPYLRATEQRLNAMLATQAAANGATLVNWYPPASATTPARAPRPAGSNRSSRATWRRPIHPNKTGMAGGAATLVAAVK